MRLRDATESRRNVLVVQMQPGKSGECFFTEFLNPLAGAFGIFGAVGVEGRRNGSVARRQGNIGFSGV